MGKTVTRMPRQLQQALAELEPEASVGIEAMRARAGEFSSPLAATMAGIAVHGPSRREINGALDVMFAREELRGVGVIDELIVGGGLHAAIYSAVRVGEGFAKPVVLEARDRAGGAFAFSEGPAFYLNSRNRPGPLGFPGESGALNVLPGAPFQPSDVSGGVRDPGDLGDVRAGPDGRPGGLRGARYGGLAGSYGGVP